MGYLTGELDFRGAVDNLPKMPKQRQFVSSSHFATAYVGGQGSGKSVALCTSIILNAANDPNGFSLVGRLNMPALETSTMKTFLEMVPREWGEWYEQKKVWKFENGHEVVFKHLDISDPKIVGHIKSMNLSAAYVDEASEISEEIYFLLIGRLRRKTAPRRILRITSNPAGHDWMWRNFFDPDRKPKLRENNFGITASTMENVFLPPEYVEHMLNTYPPDWADRFIHGSFADFSDLVFKEFTEHTHVWDETKHWEVFAGQQNPPDDWPVIVGMDIGGGEEGDPWAIPIIAVAPDGRLYQYDEVYGSGLRIKPIADELHAKIGNHPIEGIAYDYAQRAAALELEEHGIFGQPAIKEVTPGLFKTEQYMHVDPRLVHPFNPSIPGSPRYFASSRCRNTLREVPAYKWAKDRSGNPKFEPAHENSHCFAAGTRVETEFGSKPIEQIQVGERVWTRMGLRRVYWSGQTGEREVISRFGLIATADHLIMDLSNGWSPLCRTDNPETLFENRLWMASVSNSTTERTTTSVASMERDADYTSTFGSDLTDLFRLVGMFTTKTETASTMLSKISKLCPEDYISSFTVGTLQSVLLRSRLPEPLLGIAALKDWHGIGLGVRRLVRWLGRSAKSVDTVVRNAAMNFIARLFIDGCVFAPMPASPNGIAAEGWICEFSPVNFVKSNSRPTASSHINSAPSAVLPIFNIGVEEDPEFYAGGMLVHNCPSAIRYAIHTFRPEPEKIQPAKLWQNPALNEMSRLYWYEVEKHRREGEGAPIVQQFQRSRFTRFVRPSVMRRTYGASVH